MENKDLLFIMEKCGHFLYHRRGGKRGQFRILKLINEKGQITQKELLKILPLKSGSVSETVKKLENQGFILKEKDNLDKRKINISLTELGKDFLENQTKITKEQEKVLFTSLSNNEQIELETLLNKLFKDWESKFDSSLFNHRKEEG
ncbi:MAG: MarR family winged helix-turn-helix transcriptional regulator [Lachnospirales bacterium]